ncbi:unnamed protein product [Thelazia callipaeda]|uniref:Secreted protein n=1 Tax=Thelazia callipaeda TaxID=103827 RepID=A0A0N5DBJ2_THECL|nr:unnamed protein product [Thelazia callipaeda]
MRFLFGSMLASLAFIFLPNNLPVIILILHCYSSSSSLSVVEAIRCYSCANDFIVWHWRHFFLKRNYAITTSDQNCAKVDYLPETAQFCPSTCFIMYLNGTNRQNGVISVLGLVRGCSSQFLTNDQHAQLGLGPHSRVSQIGHHLSSEFDMANSYLKSPSKRRQHLFGAYFSSSDTSNRVTVNYCLINYLFLLFHAVKFLL